MTRFPLSAGALLAEPFVVPFIAACVGVPGDLHVRAGIFQQQVLQRMRKDRKPALLVLGQRGAV